MNSERLAVVNRDHRVSLAAIALFAAILALSPSIARAECAQWDASIKWTIQQDNGFILAMRLQQNGTVLTGRATQQGERGQAGSVSGYLQGNQFNVQIRWANGDHSVYRGAVRTDGRLDGVTHRMADLSIKVPWHSIRPLKCADAAPPPAAADPAPAVTPKGVKAVGARPPALRAPPLDPVSVPPPPVQRAPSLTASPQIVTIPAGQSQGSTTLTWDGGARHLYAEVWVQVDGGGETKIVEQGKGTRTVAVQAGKTYTYILTDSGERLATVTVRTR